MTEQENQFRIPTETSQEAIINDAQRIEEARRAANEAAFRIHPIDPTDTDPHRDELKQQLRKPLSQMAVEGLLTAPKTPESFNPLDPEQLRRVGQYITAIRAEEMNTSQEG